MAIHPNPETMAIEVIEEYLVVAEYCVQAQKPCGDGAYGYPAVLLLFSALDALSNYLGYPKHSFGALKKICPQLSDKQVKQLKDWFRNLLSHQAVLMPGTKLSLEDGQPFDFEGKEPTHIRVRPFYRLIKDAWAQFDKSKVAPKVHNDAVPSMVITNPNFYAPAASGCVPKEVQTFSSASKKS